MSGAGSLRALARRIAPGPVRRVVTRLREATGQLPVDDVVLADYRLVPDDGPGLRLTFAVPYLSTGTAFGGVTTGIEIVVALAQALGADRLRLIVTEPEHDTRPQIFVAAAQAAGWPADRVEILLVTTTSMEIPVARRELFVAYNFWTALNLQKLVDRQSVYFSQTAFPLLYVIQEYEPSLFEFSSANMIAREAYDTPPRLWGIFNSSQLEAYFRLQGHAIERSFVFEPVIGDSLRPRLGETGRAARARRIVIYGRPAVQRNCYPALVRGLRRWAADYREFSDWEVVSAGTPHKPVALGDGRSIVPVGKLALDAYADLLLGSRVGVSLMASPHPSYPPLEMAHMGLVTVTNRYTCKDLGGWHGNIRSIPSIGDIALAKAIAGACREAGEHAADLPPNPEFVRGEKYPFLPHLAAALSVEVGR